MAKLKSAHSIAKKTGVTYAYILALAKKAGIKGIVEGSNGYFYNIDDAKIILSKLTAPSGHISIQKLAKDVKRSISAARSACDNLGFEPVIVGRICYYSQEQANLVAQRIKKTNTKKHENVERTHSKEQPDGLFTVKQIAEKFGVEKKTINSRASILKIKPKLIWNRNYLYSQDDVDKIAKMSRFKNKSTKTKPKLSIPTSKSLTAKCSILGVTAQEFFKLQDAGDTFRLLIEKGYF